MTPYDLMIETEMKKFYNTLTEKDKRRYAAIEAMKLGHGGIIYVSNLLGCDRKTISKGIDEIRDLSDDAKHEEQVRQPGGGRKPYYEVFPDIDEKFLDVLKNHTAGDPMNVDIVWTNLTTAEIAQGLKEKHGIQVGSKVIKKLLKKHKYKKRKAQKKKTMKEVKNRNEQFEKIDELRKEYESAQNPIISMDTKKKEYIGNYYRNGHLYTREELHTYDHDFNSFAEGIIIPHAIYDTLKNVGYISIGTSSDTSEFACDNIRNWWLEKGRSIYPNATSILVLCDGGGSNSSHCYIFKEDLQKVVDDIGIEIRIAHYPPYTSKYNPVEHRFFPHVTKACQGVIFKSVELVKELMEKTKTSKGLKATVRIIDKIYQTGRKVAEGFKNNMSILFDEYLPNWNYRAVPNG